MTPIARTEWEEVWSGAVRGPWDQGEMPGDMVQPGVWDGRGIEIRYQLPEDFESRFNEAMVNGTEDEYLMSLVTAIGFVEEY